MPIKPRLNTLNNLNEAFKLALKENAGITQWNSDSIARNLFEGISSELLRLNSETTRVFEALQLEYATGNDLSSIASTRGVVRLLPNRSSTSIADYNMYFYCDTTFGNINSGENIIIPAGTKLFPPSMDGTATIVYETKEAYILKSNISQQYCSVAATTIGSSQNVSSNTLVKHNFTDYTKNSQNLLKVKNRFAITNGRNIEADSSLRYRTYLHYANLVKESDGSMLLVSLEVPGIENVIVKPGYFGIGTIGVFCFGPEGIVTPNILSKVEYRLRESLPPGVKLYISPGVAVSLDLGVTIWLYEDTTAIERLRIKQEVDRAIRSFIGQNATTKSINLNLLKENILKKVSSTIGMQSFQIDNKIFNSVFVRKGYGPEIIESGERIRIIGNDINLLEEEYLSPGMFNISFELMG